MSFAAFMDDFTKNCDDLDAFCDAVTKYDVQFDSVLLSLLDRIAQESHPNINRSSADSKCCEPLSIFIQ